MFCPFDSILKFIAHLQGVQRAPATALFQSLVGLSWVLNVSSLYPKPPHLFPQMRPVDPQHLRGRLDVPVVAAQGGTDELGFELIARFPQALHDIGLWLRFTSSQNLGDVAGSDS